MELAQMGQEEKTQKCTSPSNGFSRSCSSNPRKTKQKKVPQRGLGVAQLEKIRLEEQQKKAASVLTSPTPVASNHSLPSPPIKSSPCVVPPNPSTIRHYYPHTNNHHHHHHQPPSSIPFPSLPSLDLPLPKSNSIFRPPSFHAPSNIDVVRKPNSTSTTVPLHNNNGFEMQGHGNAVVPKLWNPNCEYNSVDLNKENSSAAVDPAYAFRPSMNNLPSFDQSNPSWSIPNFHQRPQQYHHHHQPPPPPPSLVNVSSTTSSSSSVVNFHTEPPSNQSYYSNYPTPMWSEEEKMLGIKRSYPFSLENGSGPSNNFKFPTFVAPPMRTDETTSCKNRGGTFNLDPAGSPIYREGPTCSTSIPESNSKNSIKENGSVIVNREFLTLAPPTSNRTCPNPKSNSPSAFQAFHCPEVPDYASFPYQVSSEDTSFQPGPSSSTPQLAFYTFIPPAKPHIVKPAATINNCNGEVGESVDLSLKL